MLLHYTALHENISINFRELNSSDTAEPISKDTEALKKSFRYRGAVTWNSLSAEAKQTTTLNSFYSAILH